MKICIIGSTGHYGIALDGIKNKKEISIAGIAPGSLGENVSSLYERLSKEYPSVQYFDNYCNMLDEIKPEIAVVCCYFADQTKVAGDALKRGIHVFMDKPVATSLEDLETLKNIYKQSGAHLSAMLAIRATPWFLTAHKSIKEGSIGEIRLMNAQKSYKLGVRGEHYRKRSIYGGTIPWVGSHAIDWLSWFSGEKFLSVYASHTNLYNQGHGDLEASALCHFIMTNEVFASVSIDYLQPKTAKRHDDDRIRIVGTEGVIEIRDRKVFLTNASADGAQELHLLEPQNIFEGFIKKIKGEGKCLVSAEESFYNTEACLMARTSADEKKVIYFEKAVRNM
ncbi:MAG TPA: Gfo/Idh/MocA family oxidoreductase [Clostridiales bacterium]|nr:Gfo/Idh/MocA family oxidoreductase [Clostridiales bacterium]